MSFHEDSSSCEIPPCCNKDDVTNPRRGASDICFTTYKERNSRYLCNKRKGYNSDNRDIVQRANRDAS